MLESRSSYGYGSGTGITPKADLNKWEIAYRCDDGGFGICGFYGLFSDKAAAQAKADEFKSSRSYVKSVWVQHPSKIYSRY